MNIQLPENVKLILTNLSNAGHSAFIVGGCVRDCLMGSIPKDWDITTSALPHKIKKIFNHTVDTGIAHGTVTVVIQNCNYEVTTFRIDGTYLDGRRPKNVSFTANLEEDLSRRDFTINAIAYNPSTYIIDPFNGLGDIQKKTIRCVGRASSRFQEDALRMMRAIRFSAQLSFSIDPNTYQAISLSSERLKMVSMERIRDELTKIMSSHNPAALTLLEDTNLWVQILRGVSFYGNLAQASEWLKLCPKEPAMMYSLLFFDNIFFDMETQPQNISEISAAYRDISQQVYKLMRHLKFDNRTIKETAVYSNWLKIFIENNRYSVKLALNSMGLHQLKNLIVLKKIIKPKETLHWDNVQTTAEDVVKSGECFTLKDLAIDGQALINANIPPGKVMGRIMEDILNRVMVDPSLNQREILIKIATDLLD